jgi:hypothetical protein
MIIEKHFFAYPSAGWLLGAMLCSTTFLDLPTIDQTTIVCFESHLICGLGLPPSKFLMSILNYIRCELIHLNLNTIDALSYISMQCECWLDIPPDTSLFWYFYYSARYERNVFSGIGLTLRSWDAGKVPPKNGFMSRYTMRPNGRTSTFFCRMSRTSGRNLR